MRTVTIAGGGLSGLALARSLARRGVPVALHDAGHYPRHRVCGEFLVGLDDATLARLDLAGPLSDAPRFRAVSWYDDDGRRLGRNRLPEDAIGASRFRLDAALASELVAAGGALHPDSRLPGGPRDEPGLVWAAGRRPARGGWVGIKLHLEKFPLEDELEMHLGPSGYFGAARVDTGAVNVCGLLRSPAARGPAGPEGFLHSLRAAGLPALAQRVAAARPVPGSCCAVAGLAYSPRIRSTPGLCLGDAFATVPPFTGGGMAMALQGAAEALEPLAAWSTGALDWHEAVGVIREALRRRLRLRLSAACALQPFLTTSAGRGVLTLAQRHGLLPFAPLHRLLH